MVLVVVHTAGVYLLYNHALGALQAFELTVIFEEVMRSPPTSEEQPLINSLRQDGWQLCGNRIIQSGHFGILLN